MSGAAPGRVLRLAILGWGLGDLAMGRRLAGAGWLIAEVAGLTAVAALTLALADTTWYVLPFLAGMGFIVAWTAQAIAAYRRAQRSSGAFPTAASGSSAVAVAWLTMPLLAWGTGFWLFAAESATPGAVLDRFVTAWPTSDVRAWDPSLSERPGELGEAAAIGRIRLSVMCAAGMLADDCGETAENLLHDIRVRITAETGTRATAVAEVVRFERRPSRFLGIFAASELVPVPTEPILRLDLAARPAALGSARWTIVNAEPG
ncbi:MAG TPA: hypothetical protein VK736_01430 [Candidatus Binatia bacterium]|nr:hypothetical protein [Candidatus Binatia bacterium]